MTDVKGSFNMPPTVVPMVVNNTDTNEDDRDTPLEAEPSGRGMFLPERKPLRGRALSVGHWE